MMSKVIEIIDSDDDIHMPIDANTTAPPASANKSANMESDDSPHLPSRRRRRKSVLHAMHDPDMQFQTIAIDDDDDEEENNLNKARRVNYQQKSPVHKPNAAAVRPIQKIQKTAPKILASKSITCEDMIDAAYEKFLNDPETMSDMYAIAEERTRINYLLNLNGMPEISFSLNTRPELLQFQLEECLKQRKLIKSSDNTRVQDNRRNLLQNNSDQNIQ